MVAKKKAETTEKVEVKKTVKKIVKPKEEHKETVVEVVPVEVKAEKVEVEKEPTFAEKAQAYIDSQNKALEEFYIRNNMRQALSQHRAKKRYER